MPSIDIESLDDEHEQRGDFRRANGSPLVSDPSDPTKNLRYRRPSSYAKCLDDESALTEWRIWKAMEGVARSKALQTQVAATPDEDRVTKKELREKALDKGTANEAADMGTGLHAMTARVEDASDTSFDPPEQFVPDLRAYTDLLSRYGLVSELVEVHMVNDDFKAAGTADRVYRLTRQLVAPDGSVLQPGDLVLGDLKTGAKLDFSLPGYCVQLAIYATGQLYDVHSNRRLPTPPINPNWALLVHLPFGKADAKLLWCPVNIGLVGALLSMEVHAWRNKWKAAGEKDYDAIEVQPPPMEEAKIVEELKARPVFNDQSLFDQVVGYCIARLAQIGTVPEARIYATQRWPEGTPPPKQVETAEQLVTVLDFLDEVEKRFSLPFLKDPRADMHVGIRGDQVTDISNSRGLV